MATIWLSLFQLQLGVPTASSQWVYDIVQKKLAIARRIQPDAKGGRILFLGGSNVHFGIDAKRVGKALGVPAINFGLSAVLRDDETFTVAKAALKPRDTLILALEYSQYYFSGNLSASQTDYILAHDPSYFRALPIEQQAKIILGTSAIRIFKGVLASFFPSQVRFGNYKVDTIDSYGDETNNVHSTMPKGYIRHILQLKPQSYHLDMHNRFWVLYADFLQWCAEHQIYVIVSFPSYLYFSEYEQSEQRLFFDKLVLWHRKHNIPLLGNPYDFMYKHEDMYDTRWHLNDEGRRKRSDKIITFLRRYEKLLGTTGLGMRVHK